MYYARRASLFVGMQFTIESCARGRRFELSKEFVHRRKEVANHRLFCQPEEGDPNDVYMVTVKTDGTKTVQSKRYSDLLSFQLHLIIDFVRTQRKLAHSPVKFPARSISHFAMNIIMAKHWFNRQSKFRQMTYFQQSAKISSRQNFRPYGIYIYIYTHWRKYCTCTRATCTVWWYIYIYIYI